MQKATVALQASGQTTELASTETDQNFQITDPPTQAGDLWMVTWARQYGSSPYRQEQATVMLQAETGALQAFSLTFPAPAPATGAGSVTTSQAVQTSQALLLNAGYSGLTGQSVTQLVVQPNTFWQRNGSATPAPNAAGRVAWDCVYTDANNTVYEVWVDTNSGAVIGGEVYGHAGTHRRHTPAKQKPVKHPFKKQAPSKRQKPKTLKPQTRRTSKAGTR